MAPLHPSDSHTNTHSCHYYKTRLQNIISSVPDRACAKPSCGSKTHRQVRRLRWTEPLLSLLGFSDLFFCVPLLSAVFLPSPLLTVASFHFSVFNLSSLIHRLTSGHKPSLRFIARPRRVREARMRRSVLTGKESWKTFWAETAGELEQFHLKVILLKTSLLSRSVQLVHNHPMNPGAVQNQSGPKITLFNAFYGCSTFIFAGLPKS